MLNPMVNSVAACKKARARARAKNVLLQSDPLGCAAPSTRNLPQDINFRYGQKNIMTGESAGAIISHYQTFEDPAVQMANAKVSKRNKSDAPISTNVILMTKKANAGSAANHRLRPVIPKPLPSDNNSTYTYGVKSKPDTPAALLMTDVFQREFLATQERKVAAKDALDESRRLLHAKNQADAFATLVNVRQKREQLALKKLGHMIHSIHLKQFENISAKIDTNLHNKSHASANNAIAI